MVGLDNAEEVIKKQQADDSRVTVVVQAVLDNRDEIPSKIKTNVNRTCSRVLKGQITGSFRQPFLKAPINVILGPLVERATLIDEIWDLLLVVWISINEDLTKAVEEYLETISDSSEKGEEPISEWFIENGYGEFLQ